MLALSLGLFTVLFLLGMPIWIVMLSTGIFMSAFYAGLPLINIGQTMFSSVDSFILVAAPFFLLSGNIMAQCGPSRYIYNALNKVIGKLPGGLACTAVAMSMVYAAITGSSTATLAGVAAIAVPPMIDAGYPKKFCAGLIAVSGTLGQLIPPSCYMIVYGSITQTNVATLFMSGFLPGLLVGLSMMGVCIFYSIKRADTLVKYIDNSTLGEKFVSFGKATPAFLMPVFVLAGIYTGIFTPTEAAAVSVVYGIFISYVVYRNHDLKLYGSAASGAARSTGMIFMLVATSIVFAQPLTFSQMPQQVAASIIAMGLTKNALLAITIVLWFIMGMFMDPLPILYLTLPILLPALKALEVDLIHLNILTVLSMQLANVSPPFGLNLYVAASVLDVPVPDVIKQMLPFMIVLIVWIVLIIAFPEIALLLPRMMGKAV